MIYQKKVLSISTFVYYTNEKSSFFVYLLTDKKQFVIQIQNLYLNIFYD